MTLTVADLLRIALWAGTPGLVVFLASLASDAEKEKPGSGLTGLLLIAAYFICLFFGIAAYTAGGRA